ncbi:type VI secretion system accessory protein TagJ [Bordetella genomosp. 1]
MMQLFSLHEGSIAHQLTQTRERVRNAPADADLRARLFQLSAVQGDWPRAAEQLRLSAELNPRARASALLYDGAVRAEQRRSAVFAGESEPDFLGAAQPWQRLLVQALREPAERAAATRAEALAEASACAGRLTLAAGETPHAFTWLCDGDSRLGPVCELIVGDRYLWAPMSALRSVRLLAPQGLADLVWAQAELVTAEGRTLAALVPARYPARAGGEPLEDALQLGRITQWEPLGEDLYAGVGQKMWMTDEGEYALLDLRAMELD